MTIDNQINFNAREHRNGDKSLYVITANEGFCFRNNAEPIKDDNGNVYFEHITGFTVLSQNLNELENYDCITLEEAEKEKVPEGNIYFNHPTTIPLSAHEIDKSADYDHIQIEDNFIIH